MSAVTSADEFLANVRKSQLVDEPRLAAELDRIRAAGITDPDPKKLAGHFIKVGLLTQFQAGQIVQGKTRGFLIGGKYRVLDVLGTGGMGHVLRCEHIKMKSVVAVKVLKLGKDAGPGVVERFYREARAAFGLNHPNVARAFDIDQDGDTHFLVMEYVDGVSLQELVSRVGPLPIGVAANLISQAAFGLQEAADQGWVHRDIKPANLMLDRTGTVKILDLGLARLFDAKGDNLTKQFDDKAVLGTVDYLAPEQTIDSSAVDIRADIYALGATFYFLLTQRTPFPDGSVAQKLLWHTLRDPDPLRDARPEVPAALDAVVRKMMAKKLTSRYQAPADVVDALAPWADPTSPPPAAWLPEGRTTPGNSGAATPTRSGASTPRSGTTSPTGSATPVPRATSTRKLATTIGSSRIHPRTGRHWAKSPLFLGGLAVVVLAAGAGVWLTKSGGTGGQAGGPPTGPVKLPRQTLSPNGRHPIIFAGRESGTPGMPQELSAGLARAQPGDRLLLLPIAQFNEQVVIEGDNLSEIELDGSPDGGTGYGVWNAPVGAAANEPLLKMSGVKRFVIRNMMLDGGGRVNDLIRVTGNCPGVRFENVILKGFRQNAVVFAGAAGGRDRGESLVLSRVQVRVDPAVVGGSPAAAFVFVPGRDGKGSENVDILDCRIDGAVQTAVHVRSGATYVNLQRNRFYRVATGIRYDTTAPPLPLRITAENNTFCDVKTAIRLGTLPAADEVTRLLVRNNLFATTQAFVELTDAADAGALKKLFAEARGNVRDGDSCQEGSFLLPTSQLQIVKFPPLGTDPADDATFLRYSADSPLRTAGLNGTPAGVPPP